MSSKTSIEWTATVHPDGSVNPGSTWNPIRGCTRVSPGCERCYAERVAARFSDPGMAFEGLARRGKNGPRWTGEVRMVPEHLADPLTWKRPRRVFVNSVSDLFHEKLDDHDIGAIFGVMAAAPQHTFQVLTKRPERMLRWFDWIATGTGVSAHPFGAARGVRWCAWNVLSHFAGGEHLDEDTRARLAAGAEACKPTWTGPAMPDWQWPLRNVWIGVTAEDQQRADERIPLLLQTPAAVRFASVEPQLGPVDLGPFVTGNLSSSELSQDEQVALWGRRMLDWVITGAESGPGARPYDLTWARSLRDQCAAAGTAFFYKQALDATGHKVSTPELDGRRWTDFPEVR